MPIHQTGWSDIFKRYELCINLARVLDGFWAAENAKLHIRAGPRDVLHTSEELFMKKDCDDQGGELRFRAFVGIPGWNAYPITVACRLNILFTTL